MDVAGYFNSLAPNIGQYILPCSKHWQAKSHLSQLCIASDCLEMVKDLQQPCMGAYDMVIREIKDTPSLFSTMSFYHEGR
jgi:hypothetical protein